MRSEADSLSPADPEMSQGGASTASNLHSKAVLDQLTNGFADNDPRLNKTLTSVVNLAKTAVVFKNNSESQLTTTRAESPALSSITLEPLNAQDILPAEENRQVNENLATFINLTTDVIQPVVSTMHSEADAVKAVIPEILTMEHDKSGNFI